jgi:hypothetical protein
MFRPDVVHAGQLIEMPSPLIYARFGKEGHAELLDDMFRRKNLAFQMAGRLLSRPNMILLRQAVRRDP